MGRRLGCLGASISVVGWESLVTGDTALLLSCVVFFLPWNFSPRLLPVWCHESKVPLLLGSIPRETKACKHVEGQLIGVWPCLYLQKPSKSSQGWHWSSVSLSGDPSAASTFSLFGLCSSFFPYRPKLELYYSVGGGNAFLRWTQEVI